MHRAKGSGPGRESLFDRRHQVDVARRLDTEIALRHAIGTDELFVQYQPIVDLDTDVLRAVEALVRWRRPGIGVVPPLEFIGVAEETGLIGDLGEWVLARVMADMEQMAREGLLHDDFSVSVNISPRQLEDGDFAKLLGERLSKWSLPAEAIWLEVTETAVAREPEVVESALHALHALGVRIAIDDFGVGQTSLEQLATTLPADILKLDRSFVMRMEESRSRNVVSALPALAGAMGMTLIAEGIETEEQAATLREIGYPLAQGYHLGRPMDLDALRARAGADAPALRAR
jgi:EAL domain-containing protein (putative c-di-GMP-specific phosphodiesterase class I)